MKETPGDIIILHKCTKSNDHMLFCFWDMACNRCCYCSFWAIFCPLTPLAAQKIKILKKWKKNLEISSFYICVPKIMIRWCTVPEIWCETDRQTGGWTDRRTDGQKKWHIEVGAPPKKILTNDILSKLFLLLFPENIGSSLPDVYWNS